jgi:hypothetical protein
MCSVIYDYVPRYIVRVFIIKFWLESLKGRDHSEDRGIDGRIILDLKKMG